MSKSSNGSYNKVLYWIPTILLCAGMIYSSIYWFTTSGPRDSLMVAEALNTTNTWAFFLLPLGQFIAAILILNRKMPTVRIFAYAFAMFYNLQLGLVMANLGIVAGAALEAFKVAVAVWAYFADRNRIAKSAPQAVTSGASVNA
jgi:hypothetical protein